MRACTLYGPAPATRAVKEVARVGTLILLRHAKSSWETGLPDHDRPLAERGRRDAVAAGRELSARGLRPDFVWCSTATRTRQTWERLGAGGLQAGAVQYRDEIYQATPRDILEVIAETPAEVSTLLVIGHAPGLPDLAAELLGGSELDPDRFATSAVAVLDVDQPWDDLTDASLREFLVPRG